MMAMTIIVSYISKQRRMDILFSAFYVVDTNILLQVIAVTVEDEEDIAKFKDYEPTSSSSGAGAAAAESSAPSSPKKEAVEEPVRSPEPKTVKQGPASDGERIFASPLARKLAEDNNVCWRMSF